MKIPRDSSYTPRTLLALGATMDVSKADLDRAKTKSVKVFPAGDFLQHGISSKNAVSGGGATVVP